MQQAIELPENYFRVFRSLAQLIEEKLLAMEENFIRFQGKVRVHLLYENDLDQEAITQIHQQIELMYAELRHFVDRYQIPSKKFSLRKQILVQNAFLWEDLENSRSKHIRGHGAVDERIMQDLDSFLNRMVQLSNQINHVCEKNQI
jgi:hypothetical protein